MSYFPKKHLLNKGDDIITFIDETLYLSLGRSTWWIDSGATIHIANSLQGISMRKTLQRSERWLMVANGVKADVEAIVKLQLHNVLYVPSLSRNLISVSCLADYGLGCHFGKE